MDNPWNILSDYFDTYKNEKDIPSGVADNILIGWPPILNLINTIFPQKIGKRSLDFGCGTGGFCHTLHSLGFTVTGIDPAPEMIKIAIAHSNPTITYMVGDASLLKDMSPFTVITSIMVLQFIPAIEPALKDLVAALEPGGILVFEVFNPAWVSACLKANMKFRNFDSIQSPRQGVINVGDKIDVPIFIHTAMEYNALLSQLGLKKILEAYPPFTKKFLSKYPTDKPTNIPEYLVLGYQKKL